MIDVQITPKRPRISIGVGHSTKESIQVDIGETHGGVAYPVYDGPTVVKPEPDLMQILETEKKTVKENIVVLPIPYYETTNPKGGTTVYIGD
jgi:hypothetical protein